MPHTSPDNVPTPRRVLNVKALIIFATICIVSYVGLGALHKRQIVKTRDYLQENAAAALEADEHNRAFDLYQQYLVLAPGDLKAQEIIAELLQDHGTKAREMQRAFDINERLLLSDRERDDLRVKQVQLAEKLGRYSEASGHLEVLRNKDSELPNVWHYSGIIAEETGSYAEAIDYFQKAVSLPETSAETVEHLSGLLTRERKDPEAAEALLTRFVDESAGDDAQESQAHAIRARWFLDQKRPHYAIADLWMTLEKDSGEIRSNATLLKAIRQASAADQQFDSIAAYNRLIRHYRKALSEDENQSQIRLFLSSALWATDQRSEAIATLKDGIERDAREYELYEVLVDYLVSDQQHELAQAYFNRIPEPMLDRGRREFMRGRLLMSQEQWAPAIEAFELSVGLSPSDKDMAARARICLALCRRESGNTKAAMEAYRELVKADPDSEGGRLGVASAYLRSNQLALAIAEYRQLMHVDGVPPFLANLMIRNNLALPRSARRWDDLEALLDENNKFIEDDVQRTLLTVDMIFAQGRPARAMDYLDDAARRMPNKDEFKSAYQRLNAIHGDGLQTRIQQALDDDRTNAEAHESMLKLLAGRNNGEMRVWLDDLIAGDSWPNLNAEKRYEIVAQTAMVVADGEIASRGQTQQVKLLLAYASQAWERLTEEDQLYLPGRIRFVVMYDSGPAAVRLLKSMEVNSHLRAAECWLQIARHDRSLATSIAAELVALIRSEPKNFYLRLAFVDLQILSGRHDSAMKTLGELAQFDPSSGVTVARQAMLALLVSKNVKKGNELSNRATRLSANDIEVRAIRGLALAEAGQTKQAQEVLNGIPMHDRTPAIELFLARAQQLDGDIAKARYSIRRLMTRRATQGLAPAEKDLLDLVDKELKAANAKTAKRARSSLFNVR
ncbi:MAG: tetratricopeptide repeat protein [Fuerstiella sp.]